jgi:hypothetical protein
LPDDNEFTRILQWHVAIQLRHHDGALDGGDENCANLFGIGIRAHLVVFNTPPNGPHQKLAPLLHGLA